MTRLLIIVFFTMLGLTGTGQDLKGVKSIVHYEDTIVRRILSLDTTGNVTFSKNSRMNGPVIMMGATYYDSLNRRVKSISGYSNVGFSVYTYEFDKAGNEAKVFTFKKPSEDEEERRRYNRYDHIENYTSAKDLEKDSTVLKIINSGEKYIVFERTFDVNGNELKEILFDDNKETSNITTNEYDENGNRVHFHFKGSLGEWDYYYTFDTKGNELSSKRVNDQGDTTEVHLYKYDRGNSLIEDQYLYRSEVQYTEKYYFKNKLCTKMEIYNTKEELVREQTFKYNKKGNLIKENYHDIDDNKMTVYFRKYKYY